MIPPVSLRDTASGALHREWTIMGTATTIIGAIKHHLKLRGITYQELARRLKVSEPTVKRDLARGEPAGQRPAHT